MKFLGWTVEGQAAANWKSIYIEAAKFPRFVIEVRRYDEEHEISEQQRKWWKGVLLPALSNDTGDTKESWETRLKLAVMPDEFKPETVIVDGKPFNYVPSITKLTSKKMNDLVEGSVSKLHEWKLLWVTLPDSSLRKY